MNLNFAAALAALGADAAFTIANAARPAGDYIFNTLLPEQNRAGYSISGGNMTVRSIMAGLAAMDSPYPPGGFVESEAFTEQTAKLANEVTLTEQALRHLQEFMSRVSNSGANTTEALAQEALNFLDKLIIQPHLDAMEWLRGKCLVDGAIDWTFGNKRLLVDYGIPAANKLTARTGNDAYGGSASKFWADVTLLKRALRGNVRAYIAHSSTVDAIRYNPVNSVMAVEGNGTITFRRTVNSGANLPLDNSDVITIIVYDREGEILVPSAPGTTAIVPFMEPGKLLAVGNNSRSGYVVGQGSVTDDPDDALALGYTHIAPTVEGGGRMGRWSELYIPQAMPWQLNARGVTNGLPVLEAPKKVAIATTELPA